MQQNVDVVGVGLGPMSLTQEASESIARADLLVGSARLIAEHAPANRPSVTAARPGAVVTAVQKSDAANIAILMSGDVGFHSGATKVYSSLSADDHYSVRLIAGVATPVLFAARLGVPWENACLVSCHGVGPDLFSLISAIRRNQRTFVLTGGNIPNIASLLIDAGFGDLKVWTGENLGLKRERINQTKISALLKEPWPSLTTLMIENPDWDDRVRTGIPDAEFVRSKSQLSQGANKLGNTAEQNRKTETKPIPMTKQAIRAYAMSRLALKPSDICYDIGCGTGSITVEMALSAHAGQVWAIDQKPEAIKLTRSNCQAFHIGNVTLVQGSAPEALAGWPVPDAAFIGGTSGNMDTIIKAILDLNPSARIVITAIAIESAAAAIAAMRSHGLEPEVAQLSVAQGRQAGELHLLMSQNPVIVISRSECG